MPVQKPTVKKATSLKPGIGNLIVDSNGSMDRCYSRLRDDIRLLQGGESPEPFKRFDLPGRYAPDLLD